MPSTCLEPGSIMQLIVIWCSSSRLDVSLESFALLTTPYTVFLTLVFAAIPAASWAFICPSSVRMDGFGRRLWTYWAGWDGVTNRSLLFLRREIWSSFVQNKVDKCSEIGNRMGKRERGNSKRRFPFNFLSLRVRSKLQRSPARNYCSYPWNEPQLSPFINSQPKSFTMKG